MRRVLLPRIILTSAYNGSQCIAAILQTLQPPHLGSGITGRPLLWSGFGASWVVGKVLGEGCSVVKDCPDDPISAKPGQLNMKSGRPLE